MNIDKVNYQRTFNLGNYSSERLGVELTLNPGESANQALDEAKKLVDEWHVKNNPQLYQDKTPDIPILPKKDLNFTHSHEYASTGKQGFELISIEEQINTCTSPAVLKAVYEKLVKGKPELETAYNQKLKELT